jgi:hypothetical protein
LRRGLITHCGCNPCKGAKHHQWTGVGEISSAFWYDHVVRSANGSKLNNRERKPKELTISFPKDEMESLRGKRFYVNGKEYTVDMSMMSIGRFFLEDNVIIKFDNFTTYKSNSNTILLNSAKLSNSGIVIKFSEYFFKNDITKPPTVKGGQTTDPKVTNKEGKNSKWKSNAFGKSRDSYFYENHYKSNSSVKAETTAFMKLIDYLIVR